MPIGVDTNYESKYEGYVRVKAKMLPDLYNNSLPKKEFTIKLHMCYVTDPNVTSFV